MVEAASEMAAIDFASQKIRVDLYLLIRLWRQRPIPRWETVKSQDLLKKSIDLTNLSVLENMDSSGGYPNW